MLEKDHRVIEKETTGCSVILPQDPSADSTRRE